MILGILRKRLPQLTLGSALLVGLLAFVNLLGDLGRPYGGVIALRSHSSGRWLVHPSTPPWWPVFENAGLQSSDQLLALDGEPYGFDAANSYVRAAREGRTSVRLSVLRNGTRSEIDLPLSSFQWPELLDLRVLDLIAGLCYWLLGIAVYRVRPENALNRVFGVASALFANFVWLAVPTIFIENSEILTRLLALVWAVSIPFVGVSLVHFALVFPSATSRRPRRWLAALHVVAVATGLLYAASMILGWSRVSPLGERLSAAANFLTGGINALGGGSVVVRALWLALRKDLACRLRRQNRVLLVGMSFALPFFVIEETRGFVACGYFLRGLDVRWLLLPLTAALGVVILRYHSFKRMPASILIVLIITVSAVLASLGAWGLRLVDWQSAERLGAFPFLPLMATSLAASLLWSTQTSWRGTFARLLHWDRNSYSAVRQFGQEVIRTADLVRLPATIVSALVAKLGLERAAIWIWDASTRTLALAATAGDWSGPASASLPESAMEGEMSRRSLYDGSEIEVVAPLLVSQRPVGLLGLGKRWDDEIFDDRDLEIVDLIAQQAALFLLTARQIDQLRQFPSQIAAAQERERFKIAQELHDTVQQFLGRLPFSLEISRQAVTDNPEEAQAILEQCLDEVESAAQTVRDLRNNLAPIRLEIGLARPMELLIEKFRSRTGIETHAVVSSSADRMLSLEARHALYRVIQQALDNIAAHAKAECVRVLVEGDGSKVRFEVADDGCGFTPDDRRLAEEKGSFGLKSMEARITSLGGTLCVEGCLPRGTRISGWLPGREPEEQSAHHKPSSSV